MRDPVDIVEIGALGPYDVIELHCWHCGRQHRWTAADIPTRLPPTTTLKSLEPKLVCQRCRRRGEARIYWLISTTPVCHKEKTAIFACKCELHHTMRTKSAVVSGFGCCIAAVTPGSI
jgi:hypothetical protein